MYIHICVLSAFEVISQDPPTPQHAAQHTATPGSTLQHAVAHVATHCNTPTHQ